MPFARIHEILTGNNTNVTNWLETIVIIPVKAALIPAQNRMWKLVKSTPKALGQVLIKVEPSGSRSGIRCIDDSVELGRRACRFVIFIKENDRALEFMV
jgi:hypothetical protein